VGDTSMSQESNILALTMIERVGEMIAQLLVKGYASLSFERMTAALFRGLQIGFEKAQVKKKTMAAILRESERQLIRLQHAFEDSEKNGHADVDVYLELYWALYVYVARRWPKGVSLAGILQNFLHPTQRYEDTEAQTSFIMAVLDALRQDGKILQNGKRGEHVEYFAPYAEVPMHDPTTIKARIDNHIGSVLKVVIDELERVALNKGGNELIRTVSIDLTQGSNKVDKFLRLYERYQADVRELWETNEGGEVIGKIETYMGYSFPQDLQREGVN
jgi:hypothetical protein